MDMRYVNRLTAMQITLLLLSVSSTLVPIATNYEWLATYAFFSGFLEGYFVILLPLTVQDLVEEKPASLSSWIAVLLSFSSQDRWSLDRGLDL